jgi:hypothetical protein
MPHFKTLIDTTWLGQWDFPPGREATVEIESVTRYKPGRVRKVKQPDGSYGPERNKRVVIAFKGKRKKWLSGPATQDVIAGMFGVDVDNWIGQRITLYVDSEVMMGRAKVGGIRVRPRAATGPATDDSLDREVDEAQAQAIADAFVDENGVEA